MCTAGHGREALQCCEKEEIDVVLMDIRMPIMDGVEATIKIKALYEKIKIIILTTFHDDEYIFDSLKNGASGYLLKDATPEELIHAIKKVFEGGMLINPHIAAKVVERLTTRASDDFHPDPRVQDLTEREKDICHLLGEGNNNREISELLYISEGTVKNNITRVLDKLGFRDRTQLALFAVKNRV